MNEILIDNSSVEIEFTEHLKQTDNKRILFTASFGSGKSFFLTEYFRRNKDYLDITLYPVDYSVSSNEDIFEIIKYDIIDSLFEKYAKVLDLKIEDFSNLLIAQSFLANKIDLMPLVKSIIKSSFIDAEQILGVLEASKNIASQFHNYKKELSGDEKSLLLSYMEGFENKKGSIRENDEITLLINNFLTRIKSKKRGKKFVLIIDDLDRLDPEQIFRLFNIFTAHHDSRKDINKFGFDKIIFVCDLNNLEFMFHHRYGLNSSFDGYIDKFYSHKPFFFNHRSFLKEKVSIYLTKNLENTTEKTFNNNIQETLFGLSSDFFHTMKSLSNKMIDNDLLRARNFQKFKAYALPSKSIRIGHREFSPTKFPLLVMCYLMQQFFPRIEDLINSVHTLSHQYDSNYEVKSNYKSLNWEMLLISYSIPFFIENLEDMNYRHNNDKSYFVSIKNEFDKIIFLEYRVNESLMYDYTSFTFTKAVGNNMTVNNQSTEQPFSKPNPYHIVELALRNCLINEYIQN
ncbi:hypothetical protein GM921_07560 [Pedobacter sp. LMG 31464]|uniref:KAP NTPase domain-containing protein n=1 Tax=Pedobacter planticolens TaxID=2679964 RepID=A0A923IVN4_9SPHI|nr:P-loop NTPase fold protein [Pedobacter planticolens]MBB2145334.1 hypothetical protein [Pedobacter planticolens]